MPVTLNTRRLDAIIVSLRPRAEEIVDEIANDLAEETQRVIVEMGVYDTGEGYRSVEAAPEGGLRARVSVKARSPQGAPYMLYQHEGNHDRAGNWHPGRPFMRVAGERQRVRNIAKWRRLFE